MIQLGEDSSHVKPGQFDSLESTRNEQETKLFPISSVEDDERAWEGGSDFRTHPRTNNRTSPIVNDQSQLPIYKHPLGKN